MSEKSIMKELREFVEINLDAWTTHRESSFESERVDALHLGKIKMCRVILAEIDRLMSIESTDTQNMSKKAENINIGYADALAWRDGK